MRSYHPRNKGLPTSLLENLVKTEAVKDCLDQVLENVFGILIQKHISKELPNKVRSYFYDQISEISFLQQMKKKRYLFKGKTPSLNLCDQENLRIEKDNWVRKEVPEFREEKLIGQTRIEKALKGEWFLNF